LDGIRTTSFKKGAVVSVFNTKEIQKFVERKLIAIEKSGVPKHNTGKSVEQIAEEKKAEDRSHEQKVAEEEKAGKQSPPTMPRANRAGRHKSGNK